MIPPTHVLVHVDFPDLQNSFYMKSTKLNKLFEAIHKKENKDITLLEEEVSEEIEDSVKFDSFFKLPLENIFSIVSKIEFLDIDNYSKLLKTIINGTIKAHENEKETLFLLYHIKAIGKKQLKLGNCIEILQCFQKIQLFSFLNEKYKEMNETPEIDTEYQKDKEIKELKKQIQQLKRSNEFHHKFPPINKKPMFFESDLFKAISKGKLDSVQYLIENQGISVNQKINDGNTPLHFAFENNQEKIAQYHYLKGADIEAKDNQALRDHTSQRSGKTKYVFSVFVKK